MSLSVGEAQERAYYRLARQIGEKEAGLARYMVQAWFDDGLRRMADEAAMSSSAPLLHKLISGIAISSGIAIIPSNVIVMTIAPQGTLTLTGGTSSLALQYVPMLQDLEMGGRSEDWEYYSILASAAISNASIYIRKFDGSVTAATSLTMRAGVYPTKPVSYTASGLFVDLPVQLEDNFIDKLVEIGMEKYGSAQMASTAT